MAPKQSNTTTKAEGPSKAQLDAINKYLAEKPDFDQLLKNSQASSPPRVEETEYERKLREAVEAYPKESK